MTSGRRKVTGVLLGNVVLLAGSRDRAGRQAELCSRFWLDGGRGGSQALLPDWMVPVAGLWVQEGPEAQLHYWMDVRAVL